MEYKRNKQQEYKQVANTAAGKKLISYLRKDHLQGSAKRGTPLDTYFELGKRELVQDLINYVEDISTLED